jgi:hypothetical protein
MSNEDVAVPIEVPANSSESNVEGRLIIVSVLN